MRSNIGRHGASIHCSGTFEMKEGFDREIDSLLRRRARGTAELRSWGDGVGGVPSDAHLDADELGAFAEGALPSAARLAAASHLADCERCRGVVVGLARVAGDEREVKQHAVAAPASAATARAFSWRAFVASLLAPRVMRLAVPLLALSLVGVVSYVALRSNSGASVQSVRDARPQNNGTLRVEPSAPEAANANASDTKLESVANLNSNAAPREATAPNVETKGHGGAESPVVAAETGTAATEAQPSTAAPPPPPPASAATAAEGPPAISKAAPKPVEAEEREAAKGEDRERADTRDKSARSSEPADDYTANELAIQQRRNQSRMNDAPDGGTRNQKRAADNNTANNASGGYAGAGTSTPSKEADREQRAAPRSEAVGRARAAKQAPKKADEDEARSGDTRTAAGHRFRREGNAWVDVNYKSSMPSTGVRRGTDSFRALVADVPEVGRVAEALGGEVIVVVGGRAYRIR
ncbi:MAG TPA: hypothetical protein VF297_05430 [Pyrinomonadaceae bacterium]